jgi:hypothetical protein
MDNIDPFMRTADGNVIEADPVFEGADAADAADAAFDPDPLDQPG